MGLFEEIGLTSFCTSEQCKDGMSVGIMAFFVAFPLCFLRKVEHFKYASLLGLSSLLLLALLHVAAIGRGGRRNIPAGGDPLFPSTPVTALQLIATFAAASNCHFNADNFYHDSGADIKKFRSITIYSFASMFAFIAFVGYAGYFNFGSMYSEVPFCILGFVNQDCDGKFQMKAFYKENHPGIYYTALVATLLLGVNVAAGVGLLLFPNRLAVNQVLNTVCGKSGNGRDMSFIRHCGITICLVALLSAVGALLLFGFPGKGTDILLAIFDVIVSIFAIHAQYTLPAVMYLKLKENKTLRENAVCYTLIIFGIVSCAFGSWKMVDDFQDLAKKQ